MSPTINEKLTKLYAEYLRKTNTAPKNKSAYFDELRENVATDSEINRLIGELVPTVDKRLEKHS